MGTVTRTPADTTEQARQRARQTLRNRAIPAEAHARNQLDLIRENKARKPRSMPLTDAVHHSGLLAYLIAHPKIPGYDGWLPKIQGTDPDVRLRQFNALKKAYGPLVFIRVTLSELDMRPLKSAELVAAAIPLLNAKQAALLHPSTLFTQAIQRAANTHSHFVAPLSGVLPEYAELIRAAPTGRGGGVLLLGGQAHGTLIRDTPEDFEKVARYMSRNPDSGLYAHNKVPLAYLDALETEVQRLKVKDSKTSEPRLAWASGLKKLLFF